MTTETTERDLIEEVEDLLAKVPTSKMTTVEWGNEIRMEKQQP